MALTNDILDCSQPVPTPNSVALSPAEVTARQAEIDAGTAIATTRAAADANAATLRTNLAAQITANSPARQAVTTNTTFIAVASPTAGQVAAQVKALAQQNNVIIPNLLRLARLALQTLDADA